MKGRRTSTNGCAVIKNTHIVHIQIDMVSAIIYATVTTTTTFKLTGCINTICLLLQ